MSSCASVRLVALLLTVVFVTTQALAHGPWHEGFEGGQVSWRDAGGDAHYRVHQHQRTQGGTHSGNGCEWIRLEGDGGSFIYFRHDVGQPHIHEELLPSVWVKSDRAGLQFAARIVLPRTIDPRTGQPMTTVVAGPGYADVNRWQLLRFDGLARLLNRQIRALRMEIGPQIDDREAYLDAVLLNVYGGLGITNVWIDDLDIAGYAAVGGRPTESPASPAGTAASWSTKGTVPPHSGQSSLPAYPNTGAAGWNISGAAIPVPVAAQKTHTVSLDRSVLLADGRPMFPRIVQYQGEPLELLKRLGFNTVWLQRLPAPELLEEASRLGLWLVCPPPRAATGDPQNEPSSPGKDTANPASPPAGSADRQLPPVPMAEIGPQFDAVLAWNLGSDLSPAAFDSTRRWAEQVRAADRRGQRPLICRPMSDLCAFSRLVDLVLIDRRPLGTSLDLSDYAELVRKQPLLVPPYTSVWTTVQTQPAETLRQQLAALEPGATPPLSASPEQIRLLAYTAIASGSRGLLFLSDTSFDASDPETRQRAAIVELLNLEIELMEPWAAAGSFVANADSTTPEVVGSILRTEHARLLLPIWSAAGSQCVPPQSAVNHLSLVAPGIPEGNSAYEITPGGLKPLSRNYQAGGLRVTLDEFGLTTQVVLAHDPVVIASVQRRAAEIGRRATELQRQLAARKLSTVQATAQLLASRTPLSQSAAWLDAARKSLYWCDAQLAAGDLPNAALNARRSMRATRLVERAYWDAATKEIVGSPLTSPAAASFDTLPLYWRLIARIRASRLGPNLLAGGDFEDRDTMLRAGWQHIPRPTPNVQSAADLVSLAAHSGALGLRLATAAENPGQPPAVIEMAPAAFVTPAVPVEAGQIVCIHGWVNVPTSIGGSVDGLMIIDSLSGEALADRIRRTDGWREFAMYRAVPQSGVMSVVFALSGLGEARLDDVAIQVLESPTAVTRR